MGLDLGVTKSDGSPATVVLRDPSYDKPILDEKVPNSMLGVINVAGVVLTGFVGGFLPQYAFGGRGEGMPALSAAFVSVGVCTLAAGTTHWERAPQAGRANTTTWRRDAGPSRPATQRLPTRPSSSSLSACCASRAPLALPFGHRAPRRITSAGASACSPPSSPCWPCCRRRAQL